MPDPASNALSRAEEREKRAVMPVSVPGTNPALANHWTRVRGAYSRCDNYEQGHRLRGRPTARSGCGRRSELAEAARRLPPAGAVHAAHHGRPAAEVDAGDGDPP